MLKKAASPQRDRFSQCLVILGFSTMAVVLGWIFAIAMGWFALPS